MVVNESRGRITSSPPGSQVRHGRVPGAGRTGGFNVPFPTRWTLFLAGRQVVAPELVKVREQRRWWVGQVIVS